MRHARRMQRILVAAILAAIPMFGTGVRAQSNPYRVVEEGWAKAPADRPWGGMSAISMDPDGNIWILERCGANSCVDSKLAPVLKFDRSGKLLKSFGAGMFVLPHGMYVDRAGNVWVTDAQGREGKGHTVVKFSPEGKVLLTLGKAGVAGSGPDTLDRPAGVVIAPNGDIFVADGHGGAAASRVVKFSKAGRFIKAWGKKGSAPGEFDGLHTIAIDSKGRLFVGDRGNNRFQIFDQDGNFLEEWKQFGRPGGLFIDKDDTMYAADPESNVKTNPGVKRGVWIGSARDGKVSGFIPGPEPKADDTASEGVEQVITDAEGNLYAVEVSGKIARKLTRK